jgi:hypothetical protein
MLKPPRGGFFVACSFHPVAQQIIAGCAVKEGKNDRTFQCSVGNGSHWIYAATKPPAFLLPGMTYAFFKTNKSAWTPKGNTSWT